MSAPTTARTSDLSPGRELALVRAQVASARRQVDVGVWVVIVLGLAFTAVNVQAFAAGDAAAWSPPWAVAWLLDPMVSVLLLSIVRAEQVTARWQVSMGWQVTTSKWGCFAATYVMNTWASWRAGVPSGVVLHSVPPVAVLLAAEAAPIVRDRLTAAATAATAATAAAAAHHQPPTPATTWDTASGSVAPPVTGVTAAVPAASSVVLLETPSVPAATGTPWVEGPGREGPDAVIPPAGDDPGPSQGPAPDPEPAAPAGPASGPGPGDTTTPPPNEGDDGPVPDPEAARAAAPAPVTGEERLRLLVELLDAGHEVTGPQAASLLSHLGESTSERTGRRLLLGARKLRGAREDGAPPAADEDNDAGHGADARTGTDDRPDAADGTPHRGLVLLPSRDLTDGGRR